MLKNLIFLQKYIFMKCIIMLHAFHIHFSDNSLIYQSESVPSLSVFHEIDIGQRNHSFCIFLSSILSPWFCVDNGERNEKVAENFQKRRKCPSWYARRKSWYRCRDNTTSFTIAIAGLHYVVRVSIYAYVHMYIHAYSNECYVSICCQILRRWF